jgi:hypothetical protein
MKIHIPSLIWLGAAMAALSASVLENPPGNLPWAVFVAEESPLDAKLWYLLKVYAWPACLSFCGVTLLKLQFRLSASAKPAAMVFGMSVLASLAMLEGFRSIAALPNAAPSYVIGMALSYTTLARLYAIKSKLLWGCIRAPWIVWRGNRAGVAEIDRQVAEARRAQSLSAGISGISQRE